MNPFHAHCGLGNQVSVFKPSNPTDAICRRHDIAYGTMSSMSKKRKGPSPYFSYNEADEVFIGEMRDRGLAGKLYSFPFQMKGAFLGSKYRKTAAEHVAQKRKAAPFLESNVEWEEKVYPQPKGSGAVTVQMPTYMREPTHYKSYAAWRKAYVSPTNTYLDRNGNGRRRRVKRHRKRKPSSSYTKQPGRYARGNYKRARTLTKRSVQMIAKRVHALSPMATKLTLRSARQSCEQNECHYFTYTNWTIAAMESQLRLQGPKVLRNPPAGGNADAVYETLIADFDSPDRPFTRAKMHYAPTAGTTLDFRNNDLVDVKLDSWEFLCIDDDLDAVTTRFLDGCVQKYAEATPPTGGSTYLTNINYSFTGNMKMLGKSWKFVRSGSIVLKPGDSTSYVLKPGRRRKYDSYYYSVVSTGNTFARNISKTVVFRIQGLIGHDEVTPFDPVYTKASVDIMEHERVDFRVEEGLERARDIETGVYATVSVAHQSGLALTEVTPE